MKPCIICETLQPLSEYYKHKAMSDGHINKCKTCCKSQQRDRESRLKEDVEWCEKERERCRDKYNRLYKKEFNNSKFNTNKEQFHKRFSSSFGTYKNLNRNLRIPKGYQAHHWSYRDENIKDVFILDIKTHRLIHRYIGYSKEHDCFRCKNTNELLDTREKHYKYFLDKGYDLNNNLKTK